MRAEAPVVIVGAGLMGAAAARALAARGLPVEVFEQHAVGHGEGSSHGSARIVRRAYGDPFYVAFSAPVLDLWRALESESGRDLLRPVGALDFGPGRDVPRLAASLAAAGVPHEVLPAAAAQERWPGLRFAGDVVFHPQAGTLDARAAVAALLDHAAAAGARVHAATPVGEVRPGGRGVLLADGTPVAARAVVVAAGAWVGPLLGAAVALPPLRVTRQSVFHFPRRDPAAPPWPTVIHENGHAVYHLPGGSDGGPADDRKIGLHDGGPVAVPGQGAGAVDPAARELVTDYVRRWLPGLEPVPRAETTCLYTSTPTEDFVLDRVGDLVVCSPCSGHGAKFAPLIGELVADLVTGGDGAGVPLPERFRLAAHRAGRAGSVSL